MNSSSLQGFKVPGSSYGYTATPIADVMTNEITLAVGLLDESGSTISFRREMELAVKEIVKSLRHSPRADNLMYRHCHFGTLCREVHGFQPLAQINVDDYDGCYQSGGKTSLYDSSVQMIAETLHYAEQHEANRNVCNAIIFIITDGCDYGSSLKVHDVKATLAQAITSEKLESLVTILIGVNDDPSIQQELQDFQKEVGFTQYVKLNDASQKSLAKLANFVSQSIAAQSQSLGTGGPSQSLIF